MKRFVILFLILSMLAGLVGCTPADNSQSTDPTGSTEAPVTMDSTGKYVLDTERGEAIVNDGGIVTTSNNGNGRAYYHIFVGSFSDSNGDGIGDLRGIINRFDYLNDGDDNSGVSLGVEGIWLSPIFTSPSYHKYDVTDYYEIDPKFGTMEDLQELIELCHSRNVQIILDLVVNHTSTSNAWYRSFVEAHKLGDVASPYYNFYSWSTERQSGRTFSLISGTSHLYECNFSGDMPELNFDNAAVRQAMVDVAQYYLNMGVDGFRFDAAKYIYYGDAEGNAEFWNWYMQQLRAIKPDIYTVAEVWDSDSVTFPYFESTNCFNFTMSQTSGQIALTAKAGDVNPFVNYVSDYLRQIHARNPEAMMVTFIANHDTDRAAGFLNVSSGHAKVAANLSLLLPGSTFVYYGEEIGMKGSRGGANTDANRRLAMLWGDGDTVSDPVGADYTSEQVNGTVADQIGNGDSLYNHYKKLISIRKAYPEIVYGTFTPVNTDSKLAGFISVYEDSRVVVLHNTSTSAVTVDLAEILDISVSGIAVHVGVNDATLDGTTLTIGAQTSVILK